MLTRQLLGAQGDGRQRVPLRAAVSQHFIDAQPALWQEEDVTGRLDSALGGPTDKAFAAAWQDDQRLLVGTKCNQLLQWDTATGAVRGVPLPPAPQRAQPPIESMWGACGIHCVAVNPAGDMVATGGAEPADCAVLSLPDLKPVQTLVGHLDWVFGAAWVSDRHLVTGSRDQSVALWQLPEPGDGAPVAQFKAPGEGLLRKCEGKVRDVKYDPESCRLAALSTEGTVKFLDAARGLRGVRTIKLERNKELVCMEQRRDMLVVGSAGHVALLDPRRRNAELRHVASPDDNQGVRSVQLAGHLLTFGTGRGKVFFWDMRAGAFLPTEHARYDYGSEGLPSKLALQPPAAWRPRHHLQLGPGFLEKSELFYDHFADQVQHACYTHLWDASRTRLFVGGGPLAFGLRGCYLAMWH